MAPSVKPTTGTAAKATPGDGSKGYDVVFTYGSGGTEGHHTFTTQEAAKAFADDYRKGVYSLQDGTLTSINIVPLGNAAADKTATGRLTYDESVPKGKAVAANADKLQSLQQTNKLVDAFRPTEASAGSAKTTGDKPAGGSPYNPPANMRQLEESFERESSRPTTRPEATNPSAGTRSSAAVAPTASPTTSTGGPNTSGTPSRNRTAKPLVDLGKTIDDYIKKAKGYQSMVDQGMKMIEGNFTVPHPAAAGAKAAINSGVTEQEKNLQPIGDPFLDNLLKGILQQIKDSMKSPKDLAKEQAKEKVLKLLDPD